MYLLGVAFVLNSMDDSCTCKNAFSRSSPPESLRRFCFLDVSPAPSNLGGLVSKISGTYNYSVIYK